MKKILKVLMCLLLVGGCAKVKTRTEVVDILIDAGYSRNNAGYYEKTEDLTTFRFGYVSSYEGYTESLYTVFGEGPVLIIDVYGDTNYNYQINEDMMYYTINCKSSETNQATSTEIVYSFEEDAFVVGKDGCAYDDSKKDSLIETFGEKKEQALNKMESLGLTKKDLNNLKVGSK